MKRVLIPLAPGFEDLEAVAIVDILRRAHIEVVTAALQTGPVRGSRGSVLVPDGTLADVGSQHFDAIALPGGLPGADNLNADERVHQLLQNVHHAGGIVAAICAAPKVLAKAGLLAHRRATCFPGSAEAWLTPDITLTHQAIEWDERILTGRGPGVAVDFALTLVEHLLSAEARQRVDAGLAR
jgi:protein deglycase